MVWSDTDVAVLRASYPELGKCPELQALFPTRTLTAIIGKAYRLGLLDTNNPRKRRSEAEYLELLKDTNFISLERYRGANTHILHECKVCSHQWSVRPNSVLRKGAKCPICDKNHNAPAQLYLVKINCSIEAFLKVGITGQPIYTRISKLKSSIRGKPVIELLHIISHTWHTAMLLEKEILAQFTKHTPTRRFGGYTELLSLDNNIEDIKQMMNTNYE